MGDNVTAIMWLCWCVIPIVWLYAAVQQGLLADVVDAAVLPVCCLLGFPLFVTCGDLLVSGWIRGQTDKNLDWA